MTIDVFQEEFICMYHFTINSNITEKLKEMKKKNLKKTQTNK